MRVAKPHRDGGVESSGGAAAADPGSGGDRRRLGSGGPALAPPGENAGTVDARVGSGGRQPPLDALSDPPRAALGSKRALVGGSSRVLPSL